MWWKTRSSQKVMTTDRPHLIGVSVMTGTVRMRALRPRPFPATIVAVIGRFRPFRPFGPFQVNQET
jgi:hypothetical protein